jgi:hypothetical protein
MLPENSPRERDDSITVFSGSACPTFASNTARAKPGGERNGRACAAVLRRFLTAGTVLAFWLCPCYYTL